MLRNLTITCMQHKGCKAMVSAHRAPTDLEVKKWLIRGHSLSCAQHKKDWYKVREFARARAEHAAGTGVAS